jgi:hypothetical protein
MTSKNTYKDTFKNASRKQMRKNNYDDAEMTDRRQDENDEWI